MATGIIEADFGSFPGSTAMSVDVTGQTSFNATTSLAEAWQMASADTTDHTMMEQVLNPIDVRCGNFVGGTGFTIYCTSPDGSQRYGKYKVGWAWS